MQDKASIIKLLGIPESFAVIVLTFCFVLFLAPYFSGADFGFFKIPEFTDSARKKLKIIGPVVLLAWGMLFAPVISQPVAATAQQVQSHIARARELYKQGDGHYQDAINECDKALELEPKNQEALDLKKGINKTMQVRLHIARAKELYEDRQYQNAISECDKALELEPENQEAFELKKGINRTLKILSPSR